MTITVFTIFPDFFEGPFSSSILKRAQETSKVKLDVVNIRDFATDKHNLTDDRPFGGGAGMVMKVEPLFAALEDWKKNRQGKALVLATSASGKRFSQTMAEDFSKYDHLAIICGHYEGIDQRVLDNLVDIEVRIGDYVLTGGEPAAAVMTDAIVRLLPEVLGNQESLSGESHFEPGKGNYPQYTRPAEFNGWKVPQILQDGNHAQIATWREEHRKKISD